MPDTPEVETDPDYKDEQDVDEEPLPQATDPSQVPPDEGDAGA
jgi:hypothetical protein